jgi:hypothetical protein
LTKRDGQCAFWYQPGDGRFLAPLYKPGAEQFDHNRQMLDLARLQAQADAPAFRLVSTTEAVA